MEERIKLSQAVIVEGKYDKIKLSNILDAFIIETNGFGIFKDRAMVRYVVSGSSNYKIGFCKWLGGVK